MLSQDTIHNLERLSPQQCRQWGGVVTSDGNAPTELFDSDRFTEKTVVSDGESAHDAFEKYTPYFDHVVERTAGNTGTAVLVPCSSTKPIGASDSHKQRLAALESSGVWGDSADLFIISEPCVVVPHDERLTLPPINYEFPPEYTTENDYPDVFNVFVDRLAAWFDAVSYDTVYSYVVSGHSNKIHEAIKRADFPPTLVSIPYASIGLDNRDVYVGDTFKSHEEVVAKLEYALVVSGVETRKWFVEKYDAELWGRYQDRHPVTVLQE